MNMCMYIHTHMTQYYTGFTLRLILESFFFRKLLVTRERRRMIVEINRWFCTVNTLKVWSEKKSGWRQNHGRKKEEKVQKLERQRSLLMLS